MPLQSGYNISLNCFLLEIQEFFSMGYKFGFVGRSSERNVDMFTGNPFVQIIFGLGDQDQMYKAIYR